MVRPIDQATTPCRTCLTVVTGSNIFCMRGQFRALTILLAVALPPAAKDCLAQSATPSDRSQTGVVIVKLSEPVYPTVSRLAHITGEIDLILGIGRDGKVESAVVVSGPPLLRNVALKSAQESLFECRGCSDAVTPYSLIYTFQLNDVGCCTETNSSSGETQRDPHQVMQSQNHITVIDDVACICDPAGVTVAKVRSAKCLYLWKCGVR